MGAIAGCNKKAESVTAALPGNGFLTTVQLQLVNTADPRRRVCHRAGGVGTLAAGGGGQARSYHGANGHRGVSRIYVYAGQCTFHGRGSERYVEYHGSFLVHLEDLGRQGATPWEGCGDYLWALATWVLPSKRGCRRIAIIRRRLRDMIFGLQMPASRCRWGGG